MKTYTIISRLGDDFGAFSVSAPLSDPKEALKIAQRWRRHSGWGVSWFIQEATLDEVASMVLIPLVRFERDMADQRSIKRRLLK